MITGAGRQLAKRIGRMGRSGTPLRHARGVVVSSNIGQTTLTLDGGSTHVEAYNPGHAQSLPAATVVDVLLVGKKAYILAAYGSLPLGQGGTGPVGARMYASSQTVIEGTTAQVTSMTQDWAYGGATVASDEITVPVRGLYTVSASIQWQSSGASPASGAYATILDKNHSYSRFLAEGQYTNAANATTPSFGGNDVVDAAAGDTFQLYATSTAATSATDPGTTLTWLSVVLLNPL